MQYAPLVRCWAEHKEVEVGFLSLRYFGASNDSEGDAAKTLLAEDSKPQRKSANDLHESGTALQARKENPAIILNAVLQGKYDDLR